MTDTLYFDAYTVPGERARKHPAQPWSLGQVIAEMDHCSISGALIASNVTTTYDFLTENLNLTRTLADYDHLFPVWNLIPHHTEEFPPPPQVINLLDQHDVRAVTLHPLTNGWDLLADSSQELLDILEAHRILTILPRTQIGNYRELETLLKRLPNLPILLTSIRWTEQRLLIPLLKTHKNLHIIFDHFQINEGPEWLVDLGLEDQMLYGSNAPLMSMGAHRAYFDYAEIPHATRQKIAAGNLTRLLKGQTPPRLRTNPDEDDIMTAARHGKPLPIPAIDMHMHILDEGLNGAGGSYAMHGGGPTRVYHLLNRMGIRGGGFMSWNGTVGVQSMAGNATTTAALDASPGGYFGLASFDPTTCSQQQLAKLIPQVYADPRYVGMKPYVAYGVPYTDPAYDIWWKYGNQRHYYALIHRTRGDYSELNELAPKYPNVRWVIAHCGENYHVADGAIDCIRRNPHNVYAEITLTPVTLGIIDYLAQHAGADRIVYGSDLPMRDPRQQYGWVIYSRLSRADKAKILWHNAIDILKPCWDQLPATCRPPTP